MIEITFEISNQFQTIVKFIIYIHFTSKSGEIVVSDLSCYTCDKCIVSDYEHCLHAEHIGQKRLVRPVEEPSNNADNEDNFERSENITELVSSDSVVAVKAEYDNVE